MQSILIAIWKKIKLILKTKSAKQILEQRIIYVAINVFISRTVRFPLALTHFCATTNQVWVQNYLHTFFANTLFIRNKIVAFPCWRRWKCIQLFIKMYARHRIRKNYFIARIPNEICLNYQCVCAGWIFSFGNVKIHADYFHHKIVFLPHISLEKANKLHKTIGFQVKKPFEECVEKNITFMVRATFWQMQ